MRSIFLRSTFAVMHRNRVGLALALMLFAGLAGAQTKKVDPPNFAVTITRRVTSSYDYRVVNEGSKQYLEMRQTGKQKWTRVEDVTCVHGRGRYESESFDYAYICE
jgi:hypothetical protein